MQIRFQRSGGFAGRLLTADIDTEQLSGAEAERLAQLVQDCDFFALPERLPPPPAAAADYFEYEVTVEQARRKHTVRANEAAVPPRMEPLLSRLTQLARRPRQN